MSAATDGRVLKAKHPGTGMLDTPLEAWAALFHDYMAGEEPLSDVVRRHGMRYSAAVEVARREGWATLRSVLHAPSPERIRSWQTWDAAHAHNRLSRGSTYLADALAAAPPPDPDRWHLGGDTYPELERRKPPDEDLEDEAVDVAAPVVDLAAYRNTLH